MKLAAQPERTGALLIFKVHGMVLTSTRKYTGNHVGSTLHSLQYLYKPVSMSSFVLLQLISIIPFI